MNDTIPDTNKEFFDTVVQFRTVGRCKVLNTINVLCWHTNAKAIVPNPENTDARPTQIDWKAGLPHINVIYLILVST